MTNIMPNYAHRSTPELKRRLSDLRILDSNQVTTPLTQHVSPFNRLEFCDADELALYRDTLYGNCIPGVEYFDNQKGCWVLLVTFGDAV